MFCSNCGNTIPDGSVSCPYCGFSEGASTYGGQTTQSYAAQNTQSYPAQGIPQQGYSYAQPAPQAYSQPSYGQGFGYEPMPTGKYRPLSAWAYLGWSILYCIPIIGFIAIIVNAVSDANINRRNHARSMLLAIAIVVVLYLIFFLVLGVSLSSLSDPYAYRF